ncbi:hypothetical protein E05_22180 [Plautia stali symbiont]|nr:hypothetical protein E05_22180 [Plautia stali symbiont]
MGCIMAVETKYVVVRKGEEKMTFANKKDADAWDKILDMTDAFTDWLQQHQSAMDEAQAEALGMLLAEQKDAVQHILRTSKLPDAVKDSGETAADDSDTAAPEKRRRCVRSKPPEEQRVRFALLNPGQPLCWPENRAKDQCVKREKVPE